MLTIIIVSYNSGQVLQECLAPLIDSRTFPVHMVDNASPDGSAEVLRNRFPHADVQTLENNIGYGRAANLGLEQIKTPYALLLNPDLEASVDDINKLLDHAKAAGKTAIMGPATVSTDYCDKPPKTVEWISGCAMLFNMENIKKVGFFDENIFLFFEETDLCQRVVDAGFLVQYCPDVLFNHRLGQACTPTPSVEYLKGWHFAWSRCYYFTKHGRAANKRSPKRQYRQYLVKSLTASNPKKRLKYRAQAAGAKAFLQGQKAFNELGKANPD